MINMINNHSNFAFYWLLPDITIFMTPLGTPDCLQISASMNALKGDNLCGTITHVLPAANAAPNHKN